MLPEARAGVYHVSNAGADNNDGRSPATAWRTISRVNAEPFKPGDVILLRRGDCWREQLLPRSGSEKGHVRYGAYGSGHKPLLLGSVEKNDPADWKHDGGQIWSTLEPAASGKELLGNPSFATDASHWNVHTEKGAAAQGSRDTTQYDSAPAGYHVRCTRSGKNGSNLQLYTDRFSVKRGTLYRLAFRARSTKEFVVRMPLLMRSGAPWTGYSSGPRVGSRRIKPTWSTYQQFYKANVTANDARLTFFLGGCLPDSETFYLDSLSFVACPDKGVLLRDVGNLIFDGEASCGVKVWNASDLKSQGQYWYDEDRHVLKLFSSKCPASYYSDIECAIRDHIIDQSHTSYVIYENLALKYGAAHGIGGGSTHHTIVRDCDLAYIGGGDQRGGSGTVRFGNGVEFWGNAHDHLVERCRLWEIYDAALTNQNNAPNVKQVNIIYRNNIIWNCEYSFEYWNRPENSRTQNIRFENNTCLNAGHCWGHTQRSDPSGRQLCFYTSPAAASDIIIRNNIFFEAKSNAFYAPAWPKPAIAALRMDNNCWYQQAGVMIRLKEGSYTMAQFARYQSEQNQGRNAIVAKPKLIDPAKGDYRLSKGSPCIDAGTDVGIRTDYERKPVPQGAAPDIGAVEFRGE